MVSISYPSERKSPVRLNDEQRYAIYKYVIENRCIVQKGEDYSYRVNRDQIAKEINLLKIVDSHVNPVHIKDAMERTTGWQKRLNKLPVVPLETVELETLKIQNTRYVREIEELKLKLEQAMNNNSLQSKGMKDKLDRIKAILVA